MALDRPIQVAIVGGGCAGMTAAFELTRPHLGGRFEVTLYQLGWRLGGKGASGRGAAGRIEEHGLHLWMGFYENAFRLMRDCYAELGRDAAACPIATVEQAFVPAPFLGAIEQTSDGAWVPWTTTFAPLPGLPGDGPARDLPTRVSDYLQHVVQLLRSLLGSLAAEEGVSPSASATSRDDVVEAMLRFVRGGDAARFGETAALALTVETIGLLNVVFGDLAQYPQHVMLRFLDALGRNAREAIERRAEKDVAIRRIWTIVDLTFATLRGIVAERLVYDPRGFDAIDDVDCRDWLRKHGASRSSTESAFVRGLYDLVFSYEGGDPRRPRVSAGQALRGTLRAFFTYRGSFFWRMTAGMGDVVFAPLYEVLRRRGVRFEFFHRLESVRLARANPGEPPGERYVEALEFDVQADVVGGAPYEPLVDVGGLPCWPAEPDWKQLVDGEEQRRAGRRFESFWDRHSVRRRALRVGEHFDFVVLAVGLGAVPYVARDLVDTDPRWRDMVTNVETVATQAFQVWTNEDMEKLGWPHPQAAVSGFVEPFDTWADMRHLLEREPWPARPAGLAYFCNALPDEAGHVEGGTCAQPSIPDDEPCPSCQHERVRRNAVRFLDQDVRHLWPNAVRAGSFRWEILVDPDAPAKEHTSGAAGPERFATQFWTANVNPSDRYTLSLPGTSRFRISPLDRTYDNLTIAGDWTDCGFNEGCVEAAVMSGMLAAHALSLSPALEDIVGWDHP